MHHRFVATVRGKKQGGLAVILRLVHVRPCRHQSSHHNLVATERGNKQGGRAVIPRLVHVRPCRHQNSHHNLVATERSNKQGGRAVIPRLVHVRPRLHQRSHHNLVAVLRGNKQRGATVFVRLVHFRPRLHQRSHHRPVAIVRGDIQGGGIAILDGGVHVCPIVQKHLHERLVTTRRSVIQHYSLFIDRQHNRRFRFFTHIDAAFFVDMIGSGHICVLCCFFACGFFVCDVGMKSLHRTL